MLLFYQSAYLFQPVLHALHQKNSADALSCIVQESFIHVYPQRSSIELAVNITDIDQPKVVMAGSICEGAAGSVIPPFSNECIDESFKGISRRKDNRSEHISIDGLIAGVNRDANNWVKQGQDANCWAAVISTARKFLGLKDISRDQLNHELLETCPNLGPDSRVKRRDTYQILSVIGILAYKYDHDKVHPYLCPNTECIVESLRKQRPVIMLINDHAVLVVGMDYYPYYPDITMKNVYYHPKMLQILDPEQSWPPKIENRTVSEFCGADAFITF